MRGKHRIQETAGPEAIDSLAESLAADSMAGFEESLEEGESLKAADYIRLLEIREETNEEPPIHINVRWSEECETLSDS